MNTPKIRLLVADTAPLYPPAWGGPKRIWNLYGNFSQDLFDITYVGVKFGLEKEKKYNLNRIRGNFKEILCNLPPHYNLWHEFERRFFKEIYLDLFVYLWMHTDWQFKYILNTQNEDIVICSHPWPALSIKKNRNQLFIYDAHNCEYLLIDQILNKHPLKKFILMQVKKIEGDACKKSDFILACSKKEKEDLVDIYKVNSDRILIFTNGADYRERITASERENAKKELGLVPTDKIIVFIGAYYKPNIDAVQSILETISIDTVEAKFFIIGTVAEAFRDENIPANVYFLGQISDEMLHKFLIASDVAINPMFNGSGINIKMLDYMSYGLPIITTECGARGLDTNGKNPMIISDIANFSDNIKKIINDNLLYKRMSEDGGNLILERYNWKALSSRLESIILEKIKKNKI